MRERHTSGIFTKNGTESIIRQGFTEDFPLIHGTIVVTLFCVSYYVQVI